MSELPEIVGLQGRIVRCYADAIEVPWDFIWVNFERLENEGERVTDTHEVLFQRHSGQWKRISVISPPDSEDLMNDLAVMMTKGGKTWSVCTLEVEPNGKYRFAFSYEPPKRLNGILEDEASLNYTPHPLD